MRGDPSSVAVALPVWRHHRSRRDDSPRPQHKAEALRYCGRMIGPPGLIGHPGVIGPIGGTGRIGTIGPIGQIGVGPIGRTIMGGCTQPRQIIAELDEFVSAAKAADVNAIANGTARMIFIAHLDG